MAINIHSMTEVAKTTTRAVATKEENVSRAIVNAATKMGEAIESVHKYAMFYHNQIREDKGAVERLLQVLPTLAATYGARQEVDTMIYDAAVEFVLENFGHLAVDEIPEAYKLNAIGKLNDKAEMYGGKFSLDQLGKILGAYDEYRKKYIGHYLYELESIREFEQQVEKEYGKRTRFMKIFAQQVEAGKANFKTWEEVPEYWYNELLNQGKIKLTKQEGQDYFARAKEIASAIIEQREKAKILLPWELRFREFSDIKEEDYAKIVARKLVVFEKLQSINF